MIRLTTLNGVRLERFQSVGPAKPLSSQRKRLVLLTYLALAEAGGPVPRDLLMSLFWPEADSKSARRSLRQALYCLRQQLGPDLLRDENKEDVQLAPSVLWMDALAFEKAIACGDLVRALELYGRPFLDGLHVRVASVEIEEWVSAERRRYAEMATGASIEFAARLVAAGRTRQAQATLLRARDLAPDNEQVVRCLVQVYDGLGDVLAIRRLTNEYAAHFAVLYDVELGASERASLLQAGDAFPEVRKGNERGPEPIVRLPRPVTSLIGRERAVEEVRAMCVDRDRRLITLTGIGGAGKTRLALEVAREIAATDWRDVRWVSLVALDRHELLPLWIARALEMEGDGRTPTIESLVAELGTRPCLLVLDNFEQILEAAPMISELVAMTDRVTVLATSRIPLELTGEHLYRVELLDTSAAGVREPESIAELSAVQLFVERARAANHKFELNADNADVVAEICRCLEGAPLAIELAAARLRTATPSGILAQLSDPLVLLSAGPRDRPEHQRSVRDSIQWSYDLLPGNDRALLRHLAILPGGCDPVTAAVVLDRLGDDVDSPADRLRVLADHSLLRPEVAANQSPRYTMQSVVREFAVAELKGAGEWKGWRVALIAFWVERVERGREDHYSNPTEPEWMATLSAEQDNLAAVIQWAIELGDKESALRLTSVLWWFWFVGGQNIEGRTWLEAAYAMEGDVSKSLEAETLMAIAGLAVGQTDWETAIRCHSRSIELFAELKDPVRLTRGLQNLASAQDGAGLTSEAIATLERVLALARDQCDERREQEVLATMSKFALEAGDLTGARPLLDAALDLCDETPRTQRLVMLRVAELSYLEGNAVEVRRALAIAREGNASVGDAPRLAEIDQMEAYLLCGSGDHRDAAEPLLAALEVFQRKGQEDCIARSVVGLLLVLESAGHYEEVGRLLGAVDNLDPHLLRTMGPWTRSIRDSLVESVVGRLGAITFNRHYERGASLDLKSAARIAMHLATDDPTGKRETATLEPVSA